MADPVKKTRARIPDYYPELDHTPPPVPMRIEGADTGIYGPLFIGGPPWLKAGKEFTEGATELQLKALPQTAGTILAGPVSGPAGIPGFRRIQPEDLPWLSQTYTKVGDSNSIVSQLNQLQASVLEDFRDVRSGLQDMQTTFGMDMTGLSSSLTTLQQTVNAHTLGIDNNSQALQDAVDTLRADLVDASGLANKAWDKSLTAASGVLKNAQDMLDGFFNVNTALNSQTNALNASMTSLQGSILQEVSDRQAAVVAESNDRQDAIAQEVSDRTIAIGQETANRNSALQAEAMARDLLATQIRGTYEGSDVENVTTGLFASERIARSTQYEGLSQQLALLSAGVSGSFDPGAIWYFASDIEGWTGTLGVPVYSDSWIQPASGSESQLISPLVDLNGSEYGEVRTRIRRTGAPEWAGKLWWRSEVDGLWQGPLDLTEPEYDANDIGTLSIGAGWSGNIVQIKLQLSQTQTNIIGYQLDWIAIGRSAPGASRAELSTESTARATADADLASQITVLNASLTNLDGSVGANSTLIQQIQVDNARQDGQLTSNAAAITTLQSRMPVGAGKVASASALDSLTTTVNQHGDTLTAQGASITSIQARLPAGTGAVASADALTSLSGTVTQQGNSIAATSTDLTALKARVGTAEAGIVSEQTARASGDAANATSITNLTTTVNGHTATITNVQTSVNGVLAKAGVTIDVNGYMTGWSLNNNGNSGVMKILASQFEIGAPGGGARTEYSNGNWRVYDSAGRLRVRLGIW